MTDRYENIRKALAKGPTPGPWSINTAGVGVNGKIVVNEIYVYNPAVADDVAIAADIIDPETSEPCEANAAHIAACDPDTIRELLAERDALTAEVDALRQNAASSMMPELVAVALAACDAVDDLIEKWYATRESGCLPNQVVRAMGASKLLRAIALEGTK